MYISSEASHNPASCLVHICIPHHCQNILQRLVVTADGWLETDCARGRGGRENCNGRNLLPHRAAVFLRSESASTLRQAGTC
jgi:hypothetical protein